MEFNYGCTYIIHSHIQFTECEQEKSKNNFFWLKNPLTTEDNRLQTRGRVAESPAPPRKRKRKKKKSRVDKSAINKTHITKRGLES